MAAHLEEVKVINREVHLQALNAIVKTAALGNQGATLNVLSMHVDWLYRESNAVAAEIVRTLDSIVRRANEPSTSPDPSEEPEEPSGMDRIASAYSACRDTSRAANELVEQQQAVLEKSAASLGFLDHRLQAVDQQIEEIAAIRERLVPWLTSGVSSKTHVESLHGRYTMRSERAIHERIHEAETPLVAQDRAVDDDLVLFDSSPANDLELMPMPTRPDDGRQEAAVSAAPVCALDPDALGDNVELF